MIDLTPLEVRQKKGDFRTSFRGYDPELVNDFLDLAADRMEELVKQNMELSDAVESLEDELEAYREKERALSDAVMAAQKLREDARSHADREGELMVREARLAAESARQQASSALAREEETLRQVRARRNQLVESFRRLLERELSELAVIEETLELESQKAAAATGPAAGEPSGEGSSPQEPSAPKTSGPASATRGIDVEELPAEPDDLVLEWSPAEPDEPAPKRPDPRELDDADDDDDEDELQEDWLKSLVEE